MNKGNILIIPLPYLDQFHFHGQQNVKHLNVVLARLLYTKVKTEVS
jgi:hypothetical protein